MATVSRVLPWRRHSEPALVELEGLLDEFGAHHPDADPTLIVLAHEMAAEAHRGQRRKTGEPYIHHPVAVARIVAELGLDDVTVAAALLHDAVEDSEFTLADVERQFGAEVAMIVDGVTKLDRLEFDSKEAQQAASMRKMIVAIAKDLPRHHHQARRSPPQHAHVGGPAARRSSTASPSRPSTSTLRWRTASACRT